MSKLEHAGSLIADTEKAFLAGLLKDHEITGNIVEIGTYSGDGSTRTFLDHVDRNGGTLYALDIYLIDGFLEKVEAMFDGHNGETVKGYSAQLGMEWDKPVDFLFIDGDHGYPRVLPSGDESGVAMDLINWHPHLRSGGIVAFHDYTGNQESYGKSKYLSIEYAVDGYCRQPGYEYLGREGCIVAFKKTKQHSLYFRHCLKKADEDYRDSWHRLGKVSNRSQIVICGNGPSANRLAEYVEWVWNDSVPVKIADPMNRPMDAGEGRFFIAFEEAVKEDTLFLIAGSHTEEEGVMNIFEEKGLGRHQDYVKFMDFCGWFHLGRLGFKS